MCSQEVASETFRTDRVRSKRSNGMPRKKAISRPKVKPPTIDSQKLVLVSWHEQNCFLKRFARSSKGVLLRVIGTRKTIVKLLEIRFSAVGRHTTSTTGMNMTHLVAGLEQSRLPLRVKKNRSKMPVLCRCEHVFSRGCAKA